MSEEKKSAAESLNFKRLWNKNYSDLVGKELGKTAGHTPEQVMNLIVKYFEWAESNALKAGETANFQGMVYEHTIHKPRIFTWSALMLFCSFSAAGVARWKKTPGYDVVMDFADSVIKEQKYQLAAANMVNSSMIAKELGIDKGVTINNFESVDEEQNTEQAMVNAVESVLGKL